MDNSRDRGMTCPVCGAVGPAAMGFCGSCGTPLRSVCHACGADNPSSSRFCGTCGTMLAEKDQMLPEPRDTAEYRQLTVMFCDLVGSTSLAERLGPEALREVVHEHHAACAEVIRRFGGYVAQYLGDGLLVYFG